MNSKMTKNTIALALPLTLAVASAHADYRASASAADFFEQLFRNVDAAAAEALADPDRAQIRPETPSSQCDDTPLSEVALIGIVVPAFARRRIRQ